MSGNLDYEINKELGECYLFMGDLDRAEQYYRKAMGSNGVHPDPYLGMAAIAIHRGELDQALDFYRSAAAIDADDRSLTGMAIIEMEGGDQDNAFVHLRQALVKNPENLVALYSLIRLGHGMNRVEQVIGHLEDYLAIDPLKHEIRYSLAGCLVTLGREGEARRQVERILEHDPANACAVELKEHLAVKAA